MQTLEELKIELDKGYWNSFMYGKEAYHIDKGGNIKCLESKELEDMEICGGSFKDGEFIPFYQSKKWSWKSIHKKQE